MITAKREDTYIQNKNNMPIPISYCFYRQAKLYWLPPPPYKKWEETGTYIKINDNIYAEGSYKTFIEYEFILNKRGGESGRIFFNNPVDYIKINDIVEYYLKGKLKFRGYIEYIDGAGKELSIIPIWGRLNHIIFANGELIWKPDEGRGALDVVKDMKSKIEAAGIIYKDENVTVSNYYTIFTEYAGKSVSDILDAVEEELNENWCWGVDLNNEFFFKEMNDKPDKVINYFENHFSESEYEKDTNDLMTRYIVKVRASNDDKISGSRILPVVVGSEDDPRYPPIALEKEIGIKIDTFERDTYVDPNNEEQLKVVYEEAYKRLNNQIVAETVELKNINPNIDIDINQAVRIIMKPSRNFYNDTHFEEEVYKTYEANNLYSSEILGIDNEHDTVKLAGKLQDREINLYDIDLEYRALCLRAYRIKKLFIYFSKQDERDAVGVFEVVDDKKVQRKYCVNGFGEFNVDGYDKMKIKIIKENSNIIYDKITTFFDIGVKEFEMNAREITYTCSDNALSINGLFAKMNVKLTNYLSLMNNNWKRTQSYSTNI